jgi:hypothetical protein
VQPVAIDVVDDPLPASSAIGWFVGDGGKAHRITAVQKVVNGTKMG